MLKIDLMATDGSKVYFSMMNSGNYFGTSKDIANSFNLPVDTYNDILINKVIRHSDYEVNLSEDSIFHKDVVFRLDGIDFEIYIKRFKEVFHSQLILLTLGGV